MYGGFRKSKHMYTMTKIFRSVSPICFLRLNTQRSSPDKEAGAVHVKNIWREGYGRISGGMWVLELEADIREAAPMKGARSMSTNAREVEHTHQGGWNSTSVRLSNCRQQSSDAARKAWGIMLCIGNLAWRIIWLVRLTVRTCTYREVLVVQHA
jgi:hypothetical protein